MLVKEVTSDVVCVARVCVSTMDIPTMMVSKVDMMDVVEPAPPVVSSALIAKVT